MLTISPRRNFQRRRVAFDHHGSGYFGFSDGNPDKAILQLEERPSGQPEALKAWFYPGENFGVGFVYPTQK